VSSTSSRCLPCHSSGAASCECSFSCRTTRNCLRDTRRRRGDAVADSKQPRVRESRVRHITPHRLLNWADHSPSLRQVQGAVAAPPPAAGPGVPAGVPAQGAVPAVPNANPNPDAVQPSATVPASVAETGLVDHYSVTVVWVETMIGGTSKTWVPKTVTALFPAVPSQGAMPAKYVH
jgi:hypothetical protein